MSQQKLLFTLFSIFCVTSFAMPVQAADNPNTPNNPFTFYIKGFRCSQLVDGSITNRDSLPNTSFSKVPVLNPNLEQLAVIKGTGTRYYQIWLKNEPGVGRLYYKDQFGQTWEQQFSMDFSLMKYATYELNVPALKSRMQIVDSSGRAAPCITTWIGPFSDVVNPSLWTTLASNTSVVDIPVIYEGNSENYCIYVLMPDGTYSRISYRDSGLVNYWGTFQLAWSGRASRSGKSATTDDSKIADSVKIKSKGKAQSFDSMKADKKSTTVKYGELILSNSQKSAK
ncbi:MAG: hypothetical protein LUH04_06140 [Clostridium sp.]|nr:hypothetical protein [Clostridium sp.]